MTPTKTRQFRPSLIICGQKRKRKKSNRRVSMRNKVNYFNQETQKMTTAMKVKTDGNTEAFEKTIEAFEPAYYGVFSDAELEIMRLFFDQNTEAQRLGNQAAGIRQEVETVESQITAARRQYAGLIAEGRVDDATSAVSAIPSLRKKQEHLLAKLPSISARLDELEKSVGSIDHSKFLTLAKQAADDAEKMRCRAVSIFGKPSDVRKTIAEARSKLK